MCLVHGDDEMRTDALGRRSCGICAGARAKVTRAARRNVRTGRHPRETLLFVSNALLRERFELLTKKGMATAYQIAVAAGYETRRRDGRGGVAPDVGRLQKQLGIISQSGRRDPATGERCQYFAETMTYDAALRVCKAMGVEYPAEVGL